MKIMPDHVHIFIEGKPCFEPQYIVNQLKEYTSRCCANDINGYGAGFLRYGQEASTLDLSEACRQRPSGNTSRARKENDACFHLPPDDGRITAGAF